MNGVGASRGRQTRQRAVLWALALVLCAWAVALPSAAFAAAPQAGDVEAFTDAGTAVEVYLEGSDPDDDPITATVVTTPGHGSVDGCPGLVCTYTPAAGFSGDDSFTYRVSDGTAQSAPATATIHVSDPAAPVAYDVDEVAVPGTARAIQLAGQDPAGGALTFSVVTPPASGTLGPVGAASCSDGYCTATVSYTPAAVGSATFTYRVSAAGGKQSTPATVTVTVQDAQAPEAFDTSVEVRTGATTTITLSGQDQLGAALTFAVTSPPAHGSLTPNGAPSCSGGFCEASFDFAADAYLGSDSFAFTVSNGTKTSAPATVDVVVAAAPCVGTIVGNGTVRMGVNCRGELVVSPSGGGNPVGIELVSTGNDSISPGCPCEGWGAADETTGVTGYANQSSGTSNASIVSFDHTASTATSVVDIGSTFRVTHDFRPAPKSPNLYQVSVTIKNTSASATHLRYRRVMDWDVEPTAFSEFVTLDTGTAPSIVFSSDDGFAPANALSGPSQIGSVGDFTDAGPDDHGALFDFDFGTLAPGATKQFSIYYGGAPTETGALAALSAVGVEAYSLGEPSTPDGPTLGTPNTFAFGFTDIGGQDLFAPHAADDAVDAVSGHPTSVNVVANDSDPDGDPFSVVSSTAPAHGTATCGATTCTYTSTSGYTGPDAFTYTIKDSDGATGKATVKVTVLPNHAPVAVNDTSTTAEDTAKVVAVTGNDTDADGDPLVAALVTGPAHGTAACSAGSCTYTPAANFNGADSFTYRVSDGQTTSAPATVSMSVTAVNDAPVAVDDAATTGAGTPKVVPVTANDTDVDGDTLTAVLVTGPSHGTATCSAGSCTYTPAAGYSGPDSFTYRASDGTATSAPATVSMTVTPGANHAPVAVDDTTTTAEDTTKVVAVTGNDTDADGDTLTASLVSAPAHGTASCSAGSCTYTPAANFSGSDSFTYKVSDGQASSGAATVSVSVTPVNDAPVAVGDTATTPEDTAKAVAVTTNDTDVEGDPLTASVVTQPAHGTASCSAGACTYTPAADFNGSDSFTYRVSDGQANSAPATVSITVTPVNDAPVAVADAATTAEDTAKVVAVTANDSDVDGDALSATLAAAPAHGTATCSAGSCTYTPAPNYHGPDSFTYRAGDGVLTSSAVAVTMTVTSVNDLPVAVDDAASTPQGVAKVVAVTANDTDADGDPLTASLVGAPAHGTATCAAGSCTYTPTAGFAGSDSFTYRVSDGTATSAPATVTMTVTPGPANHAPVAVADAATTPEDTATVVAVTANDTDADGDPLTASLVSGPAHGTATCAAGSCTYTPAADHHGPDAFTYQVSDGKALSGVATVSMTVTSVNDGPVARNDALAVDSGQPGAVNVLANDSDVDGDALSVSVAAQPGHGTVSCVSAGACTYRSAAGYSGADSFQYRVDDGHGGTATASVAVTVKKVVTLPSAPRKVEATSGSKRDSKVSASVAWKEPKSDGGSPVTEYVVVVLRVVGGDVEVAKKLSVDGDVDSVSVKLPAGRYRFKVAAVTSAGTGPFSALSEPVKAR